MCIAYCRRFLPERDERTGKVTALLARRPGLAGLSEMHTLLDRRSCVTPDIQSIANAYCPPDAELLPTSRSVIMSEFLNKTSHSVIGMMESHQRQVSVPEFITLAETLGKRIAQNAARRCSQDRALCSGLASRHMLWMRAIWLAAVSGLAQFRCHGCGRVGCCGIAPARADVIRDVSDLLIVKLAGERRHRCVFP